MVGNPVSGSAGVAARSVTDSQETRRRALLVSDPDGGEPLEDNVATCAGDSWWNQRQKHAEEQLELGVIAVPTRKGRIPRICPVKENDGR